MTTEADAAGGETVSDRRVEAVVAAIEAGGERIRREQVARAATRLEACGGLSDDQYAVVETMAENVVDSLLAPPAESLRSAAAEGDRRTVEAAVEVFDPHLRDGDGDGDPPTEADHE